MRFDHFTRRLYELLKRCHNGRDYEPGSVLEVQVEEALGDYERAEILKEPLPEWAVGLNTVRCIQAGAQLFTRNGARTGNAYVLKCESRHRIFYWKCITESGNAMDLTDLEIREMFTIGPYLCDPKEVENRYGRSQQES